MVLSDVAYMNNFWKEHAGAPVDERVRAMMRLCKGRVLDVGCGKGQYMRLFKDCVGVDYSIEGLKSVKGVKALADAERLPFQDGCFDTVFVSELLEHVRDDTKVVEEMKRVLKNNGLLIVSVPNMVERKEYWAQFPPSPSDKREYTPESLKKVLGEGVVFHNYRRGNAEKEVWLIASVEVKQDTTGRFSP